jgi:putative ABC transport system permease protein
VRTVVQAPPAPPRAAASGSGGGVLRTPPWTRAPGLPLRQPAVLLAVIGACAILACASASPALFLSSASSAALQRIVAAECPDATDVAVRISADTATRPDLLRRVSGAFEQRGLGTPAATMVTTAALPVEGRGLAGQVALFSRAGVAGQVTRLSGTPGGRGVWLPASVAGSLRPGEQVRVNGVAVPVAGTYQDLFDEPVRPEWCSYQGLFIARGGNPPPALALLPDPATYLAVVGNGSTDFTFQVKASGVGETLSRTRVGAEAQTAAYAAARVREPQDFATRNSGPGQLPAFVERTTLIRDGLRGPVLPIGVGGTLLALLLVGAAGSYWADRRRTEVRLLSARGVGPAALAVKAVLELALPALVGAVLGWLLARWLVATAGPSPTLDAGGATRAAVTAGLMLLAGLALLGFVAGLRSRDAAERPLGVRRSRLAAVPWELLLLGGSGGLYLLLRRGDAVVVEQNIAQVNLLVVAFPLLFILGAAVLVVRLLTGLLPLLTRRAGRLPPALYLAARRLGASRAIGTVLLATACAPVATMVYASALTETSRATLDAKAAVFAGSEVSVSTIDPLRRTPATDAVGTVVIRYLYPSHAGLDFTVLAIDPDTFERTAFWDDRFAGRPLPELMALLRAQPADGRVPALVVDRGPLPDRFDVGLGRTTVRLDAVGTARVFPGRRLPQPLVIVDRSRLGTVDRFAGTSNELWSRGDSRAAQAAVAAQDARLFDIVDRDSVFRAADFLGIAWAFDYLGALAVLVGLVAVGGLLLYVETRQRSRVASYALGRRMGLTRAVHFRSLLVELGLLLGLAYVVGAGLAWAAVELVYRLLDVDVSRPPAPLLTTPVSALVAGGVAAVVVTLLTSLYAQRSADRGDVAKVLRLS